MKLTNQHLMMKIILGIFAALLVAWLMTTGQHSTHQDSTSQDSKSLNSKADIACHGLLQWCGNDDVQVKFSQTPKAMEPFELQVKVKQASGVNAKFSMVDMDMGENAYQLVAQNSLWLAKVTLPVCMHGGGHWRLDLEVNTAEGVKKIQIPFSTQ